MAALDKLSIDTPEQVALDFALASIGSRFLALAVDTLIQAAATIALAAVGFGLIVAFSLAFDNLSPWILAAAFLVYFLIYQGYFAVFEAARDFSEIALNERPGGSMSPFWDPPTVTSTPHSSWR